MDDDVHVKLSKQNHDNVNVDLGKHEIGASLYVERDVPKWF